MTFNSVMGYEDGRASVIGERAVVVGGSMAGLCASGVLDDWFEEVVVLERDQFPEEPIIRDGAPQTSQPHALLEAGRQALDNIFPGFSDAVENAGGLLLDAGSVLEWYDQGGVVTEPESELPQFYASRPLFEHVVREQVRDLPDVHLRGECHLISYEHDSARNRVTGVQFRDETGTDTSMDAELVVDATGRTSRTPDWLADHGYPSPEVQEVEIDVTYSTTRIERPPDDHRGIMVAPEPDRPRGAAMLPVENGRWEVILQGIHGERAPADRETFIEWTEELPVDGIATAVREQEWVSDIQRYPFPSSTRRRYDNLERFPDGLVVTGDAIASFNPIYGQGMSVAAMDAVVIHQELADGIEQLGPRVFDSTSEVIDEVWKLAVGNDFIFDETTGPKPFGTDIFNQYAARLIRRAHDDGTLAEAFLRVFRLERPATSLLHPRVLWRVFRPRLNSTRTSTESDMEPAEPPAAD